MKVVDDVQTCLSDMILARLTRRTRVTDLHALGIAFEYASPYRPYSGSGQETAQPRPTTGLARKVFLGATFVVIGGALWWRYATYSTYPDEVKSHLRLALLHHKHKTPRNPKAAEVHYLRGVFCFNVA